MEDTLKEVTTAGSPDVTRLVGRWDMALLGAVLVLTALGLLLVLSATINPTEQLSDARRLAKFVTQAKAVGLGIAAMLALRFIPLKWLWRVAVLGLIAAIPLFLLMKLGVIGETRNGSSRWVEIFGVSVQPSEFVKVAWAIVVCAFVANRARWINNWSRSLVWIMLCLAPFAIMLAWMKDVGSAVIMAAIMFMMLLVGGLNLLNTGIFLASGVIGILIVMIRDNVKAMRVLAYLFQDYVRQGFGFQLEQSRLAIKAGGIMGTGLGHGVVHVWSNLPESENDMIIAVAGEELGFVGLVCICILYTIIALRGLAIARMAQDAFRRNLAFLTTILLCLPAAMHLAVNVGLIPAKGLVCPFLSAGGSAMITSFACVGILQRLHIETTAERVVSPGFIRSYEEDEDPGAEETDGGARE